MEESEIRFRRYKLINLTFFLKSYFPRCFAQYSMALG